jgi:protein-disulfide isomerase
MSTKKVEARERVKAMREEQARKDRARERTMRLGIAAAVLVGVAIIAIAVISSRGGGDDGPVAVPAAAAGEGEPIVVGDADAPVTIDNWMDFRCPHCQSFEQANGAQIAQWVDAGEVQVAYHPVTYTVGVQSPRANNAFACAADEGMAEEFMAEAFVRFEQWTNNQLVSLGQDLGIGGDYASCVRDGTYTDWSTSVTDAARGAQIGGTPTIFVNGEMVDNPTPDALAAAVAAAGGESPEGGAAEEDGDEDGADDNTDDNTDDEDAGADED